MNNSPMKGWVNFVFCGIIILGGKIALQRRPDVYKLETEFGEEPLLDTLPFISHNTLNISRDINSQQNNSTNNNDSKFSCIAFIFLPKSAFKTLSYVTFRKMQKYFNIFPTLLYVISLNLLFWMQMDVLLLSDC